MRVFDAIFIVAQSISDSERTGKIVDDIHGNFRAKTDGEFSWICSWIFLSVDWLHLSLKCRRRTIWSVSDDELTLTCECVVDIRYLFLFDMKLFCDKKIIEKLKITIIDKKYLIFSDLAAKWNVSISMSNRFEGLWECVVFLSEFKGYK